MINTVVTKNKIKEARVLARLSQKEAYELFNVPKRTWQSWELGERVPVEWLAKLILEKLETFTSKRRPTPIIDVCCGSRMFWLDKKNQNVVFMDNRVGQWVLFDGRTVQIKPDVAGDFTAIPFLDKSFKLVVFDPPHLKRAGKKSFMAIKYGRLDRDWRKLLRNGFSECWRVLDDYGVLIFKWSEHDIKLSKLIDLFPVPPLFGHPTNQGKNTHWLCFMKGLL